MCGTTAYQLKCLLPHLNVDGRSSFSILSSRSWVNTVSEPVTVEIEPKISGIVDSKASCKAQSPRGEKWTGSSP